MSRLTSKIFDMVPVGWTVSLNETDYIALKTGAVAASNHSFATVMIAAFRFFFRNVAGDRRQQSRASMLMALSGTMQTAYSIGGKAQRFPSEHGAVRIPARMFTRRPYHGKVSAECQRPPRR